MLKINQAISLLVRFSDNVIFRINKLLVKKISQFFYRYLFSQMGKKSFIKSPMMIINPQQIKIGDETRILYKAFLAVKDRPNSEIGWISIGDNCYIGNFAHIVATKSITIENNVLIADRVYISDNLHNYERIDIPVKEQPLRQMETVIIGEGSWIGENVCVIGAKIGKHCIVGANSVVTGDIPDGCVAAGIPARIIRQFNPQSDTWEHVSQKGVSS